jgi:membrane fusion protein (multidrug efflux system)
MKATQATSDEPMKMSHTLATILVLISVSQSGCYAHHEEAEAEQHKIVVTTPKVMDVDITQPFVCQIHSKRHIKVRALQSGYLEAITVNEGQSVVKDQTMFKVIPILYRTKLDADVAEAKLAELELNQSKKLHEQQVVAFQEVMLYEAKLQKAKAKVEQAKAELNFTEVKAAFNGVMGRQEEQDGALVKEGDVLTTLSDNSLMWVYFNVPEARYIQYMAEMLGPKFKETDYQARLKAFVAEMNRQTRIELVLADGGKFSQRGTMATIEARFNNENGNIAFRADFLNPNHLLRHGMTGNIVIHKPLKYAIVIPQRATFEILQKQYVYVLDEQEVVHQREIQVEHELEDVFVIKSGLAANDRLVYEGVRQVHDGQKLEGFEARPVEQILKNLRFHSE